MGVFIVKEDHSQALSSNFWQFHNEECSPTELQEMQRLRAFSLHNPPELEDIWKMMDRVWKEAGCKNWYIQPKRLAAFYQHPVWLLNGIFIEHHVESLQHRMLIADWIAQHHTSTILDFGGGCGTLARMIAQKYPQARIDIYEPYPTHYACVKSRAYAQIRFIQTIDRQYECLMCMDVLEHVIDPLSVLVSMIGTVQQEGTLIFANNFTPLIQCHLPSTFYLRETFDQFTKVMGLQMVGRYCDNYITIYTKTAFTPLNWTELRRMEAHAKLAFWRQEWLRHRSFHWRIRGKVLLKAMIGEFRVMQLRRRGRLRATGNNLNTPPNLPKQQG